MALGVPVQHHCQGLGLGWVRLARNAVLSASARERSDLRRVGIGRFARRRMLACQGGEQCGQSSNAERVKYRFSACLVLLGAGLGKRARASR